jgi:hypothetical protein
MTITQQKVIDLLIVVGIFIVGVLYYALFLRPRSSTHWHSPEAPLTVEDPTHGSH